MSEPKVWMMLPKNSNHPDYREFHVRDSWCERAGCVPVCNPETVCCEAGRFNEIHDCRKQPPSAVSKPEPVPDKLPKGELKQAISELRAIPAEWKNHPDPLGELREIRHGAVPPEQWIEPMIVEVAREAYDRFAMGGWEPQDMYGQLREIIQRHHAPVAAAHARGLAKPRFNEQTHIARMVAAGCAIDFTDDLNLVVTNERAIAAEAERDRQYEFNIGQIAKLAAAEAALTAAKARIKELEKDLAQEYADDEVVTNHANEILGKYEVDLVASRANSEAVRRLCEVAKSVTDSMEHLNLPITVNLLRAALAEVEAANGTTSEAQS